ncbi:MAG TPA: zf-HC2 domain-containing protein [Kofleriaceae bacterium]|nr:zf-HC2 domain-containing protein [Kofleriaceae bacterium]
MSLCKSIETLSMAYLDDELAAEERHELEAHLTECATCRAQLEQERADLSMVRRALAAPPTPDLLRARVVRALDEEDRALHKAQRRRWSQYMLPGSAMVAAAAAIALFIGVQSDTQRPSASVNSAAKVTKQSLPLEVQGASTGNWLKQNFAQVDPPQFTEPGIELIGARATAVAGHDAALLRYLVNVGVNRVSLTTVLIADLRGDELSNGQELKVGNLVLHVHDADGQPAVSYVDANHVGYVFTSERMSAQELLELVITSDLIGRAQQQIR